MILLKIVWYEADTDTDTDIITALLKIGAPSTVYQQMKLSILLY